MTPPENAASWYRIQANAEDSDSTDVFIYDSIGGWFGMFADEFIESLNNITTKNISVRLNSPGGSLFEGVAIANAIRSHPANVTCFVDSLAASVASLIALAGDRLVMKPQSLLMIHDASTGTHGNAEEMRKTAAVLEKLSDNIAAAYASRAGGTKNEWRDAMLAETWFTAEEAVTAGLADEALPMPPRKTAPDEEEEPVAVRMQRTWDLSMYRYAGREQAPEPKVPAKTVTMHVELDGKAVSEHVIEPLHKAVEDRGGDVTAALAGGITEPSTTQVLAPDPQGGFQVAFEHTNQLLSLIRSAVRDEVTEILAATSPKHSTAVEAGTWDAGANEKRLPSPVPLATVKKMYTYWDADKVEDGAVPKTAAKLPHHFVSEDGTPGAASVNGVRNALARLPQTQGLSDAERSAAEAHLRAHLNAFDGDEEDLTDTDPQSVADTTQPDDSPAAADPPTDETPPADDPPPAADTPEIHNEADDWTQVVGFLVSPTSSSADDVFAQLKEGW